MPTVQKLAGGRAYQQKAATALTTSNLGGIEPAEVSSILRLAESGDLERWADLCAWMMRTDPHVRSVVMTRIQGVASSEIKAAPGRGPAGSEAIAEQAARDVELWLASMEEWEDRFADLLYGAMFGVALLEKEWIPSGDGVDLRLHFTHPRDVKIGRDWSPLLRTYVDGHKQEWLDVNAMRDRFVVHAPHNYADRATVTGELHAVVWPWLFKRMIERYGLEGFGRLANGLLYGIVSEGADKSTATAFLEELESLSADGIAVFRLPPGVAEPVKLLEPAKDPGSTMKTLLDHYNGEISKALLGSGLNVEVGSTGGNRSLGESQFATTTLPRLEADAKRALGTVQRDVVKQWLRYNAHRYGGVVPPTPELYAVLVQDEPEQDPAALQALIAVGAVKVDELRVRAGLDPIGGAEGDRYVAPPPAPSAPPAFSRAEEVAAPRPFSRRAATQLSLPTASPTSTRSETTPLARLLSGASEDPER